MKSFGFRGYEFHSARMWQQSQIDIALDFIRKYDLNALIFHENDLIDQLVFPEKYFDNDMMWAYWPVRRQGTLYRRDFINKTIRKCKKQNTRFYLEVKEIDIVDAIFEIVPDLRQADGTVCPNNPFWPEFMTAKLQELFEFYPDIAGIIVSLGTRESPVSVAANRCHCERCRTTSDFDWYVSILKSMFTAIDGAGKDLIVRDFAYTASQQSLMIKACEAVSDKIIISLKAEPHDYYPTFPINPEIGHTGKLREYIEFDTWGQFFGMGVSPMSLAEDIEMRLHDAYDKGADGVWFRSDWELMPDASVHCSPSLVNLYAGAMISRDLDTKLDDVYQTWVKDGLFSPMYQASEFQAPEHPTNPEAWKKLRDYMKASWTAFTKTSYILGHQYLESDQPPYTIEKGFEVMTVIHSRDDWEPNASARVSVTKENMAVIFEEKRQGIEETKALYGILDVDSLGVSEKFAKDMRTTIDGQVLYAEFCDVTTKAMYLTSWAEKTKSKEDILVAEKTVDDLEAMARKIEDYFKDDSDCPYYLYSRLHPVRIRRFKENVRLHLERI